MIRASVAGVWYCVARLGFALFNDRRGAILGGIWLQGRGCCGWVARGCIGRVVGRSTGVCDVLDWRVLAIAMSRGVGWLAWGRRLSRRRGLKIVFCNLVAADDSMAIADLRCFSQRVLGFGSS